MVGGGGGGSSARPAGTMMTDAADAADGNAGEGMPDGTLGVLGCAALRSGAAFIACPERVTETLNVAAADAADEEAGTFGAAAVAGDATTLTLPLPSTAPLA